ncbi:MAG: metallophosphoesterase family protein [Flavobacteriales bacterium]
MKIGLLSDTHSYLHPKVFEHFEQCDEIWHAGDIGSIEVYDRLNTFKPTRAVYGNIDNYIIRNVCPKDQRFNCQGLDVWMTHIGGYPYKYSPQIRKELDTNCPKLFICGHSHILKVMYDEKRELLHMNPGAAGKYGIHKKITMLRFDVINSEVKHLELIEFNKN